MKIKVDSELIGGRTALILSLLALSAFSFHLENDILAASFPFVFFDPFEKSSSSPAPAGLKEICNDGQDN
ncbi:MAG: hypothetical protein WB664_01280, partial [Nitrososphaeraceae archaeon]